MDDDEQDDQHPPSSEIPTSPSQDLLPNDGDGDRGLVKSGTTIDRSRPLDPSLLRGTLSSETAVDAVMSSLTATRESSSGQAALFAAISRLSPETQLRHLDNEMQLATQGLDLEKHRLDVMARDRSDKRSIASRANQRRDVFVFIVVVLVIGIVAYLYVDHQSQVATPILTLALGLVSGWVGGSGYARSKRKREASDD